LQKITINKNKMKKIILSAVAVFAFGFANAQGVKFGAKVALNVASLTGDVEDASSLVGFQIGGFAEFKISEKFAFQPELMYSAQGGKESVFEDFGAGDTYTTDSKYKLSYLNIPVMAKYYATPKLSIEFGPQVGFLLSAKKDVNFTETFEGISVSGSGSVDIKDSTSSVDFGVNLGAGYDFTENISAGLRYNLGLSNIVDSNDSNSSVKNGVLSVSLGYKF
jgi:opacity protein-like surface antigen